MALWKRGAAIGAAFLMGATALAGVAGAAASQSGVVVVAYNEDPTGQMDPLNSQSAAAYDADQPVLEGLSIYQPENYPKNDGHWVWKPQLATSVPTIANGGVSKDGLTVVYHLKKNIRFSNGEKFTAADVIWNWEAIMEPNTNAYTVGYNQITQIDGTKLLSISKSGVPKFSPISDPNPYKVVIHFSKPFAPYLTLFSGGDGLGILPMKPYAAHIDNLAKYVPLNFQPIGTGPFMITSYRAGDNVTYKPNPYYAGESGPKPSIKELVFKVVPDFNTGIDQLRTGEIQFLDGIQPSLATYQQLESLAPKVVLASTPGLEYQQWTFNLHDPILKNVLVRRAIYYALNRQQTDKVVAHNKFQIATSDQPPLSWAYDPHIPVLKQDLKKADQLLTEAGWKMGKGGIRYNAQGQPLKITISTTAGNDLRAQIMELTQAQLKQAGIQIVPQYLSADGLFGPKGALATGHFQMSQFAWLDTPDPDDSSLWQTNQTFANGGENFGFFSDPIVDQATADALTHLNQARRKHDYDLVQQQLFKEVPMIPLFYMPEVTAHTSNLHGTTPNNFGNGLWNVNYWHLSQ